MTDNRPVEPPFKADVEWEYEWYTFMDRFRLWKRELFDNKMVNEKDTWEAVKATVLHSGLTEERLAERKSIWNKTCWKNLCVAVNRHNRLREQRSWQAEGDGYTYKWLITLHLASDKTMTDAYEAATTFCQVVSWCDKADYCIEYHTDNGSHPHAHILVYTNNKRMSCISNIRNSLIKNDKITNPDLRKILIKPTNIDIKGCNINTQGYIRGIKTDSKEENINADKHLRQLIGLEDFYTHKK